MYYTKDKWKAYKSRPHDPDSWEWEVSAGNIVVASRLNEANAHLIAAAPDMHEVLKGARALLSQVHYYQAQQPVLSGIDNALAKAEVNEEAIPFRV